MLNLLSRLLLKLPSRPAPDIFCITEVISDLLPICVVDIGAMAIDGASEPYAPLGKRGLAHIIGFEASEDECRKLASLTNPDNKYLPYVVYDGSRKPFYVTESLPCSSIFEPNTPLISQFHDLPPLMKVSRIDEVKTTRLDDIPELKETICDYLKLDIQGAELGVLRNGERILNDSLVVHSEVEFLPLYRDQPLFADVDQHLRNHGFMFHRFASFGSGSFDQTQQKPNDYLTFNQELWADAVYVRDFSRFHLLEPERLLKLSAILHEIYRSFDLCHLALSAFDRLTGDSLAQTYLDNLDKMVKPRYRHWKLPKMLRPTILSQSEK